MASIDFNDPAMLHLHGRALAAAARHTEATTTFRRSIGINASVAAVHRDLAGSCWILGDLSGAHDALRSAAELTPQNASIHLDVGRVLMALGRNEEAVAALRHSVRLDAAQSQAHRDLGQTLMALQLHDEAVEAFTSSISLAPNDAATLHEQGRALAILHRHGEAVGALRRAIEIEPERANLERDLGRSLDALSRGSVFGEPGVADCEDGSAGNEISLCFLRPLTQHDLDWVAGLSGLFAEVIVLSGSIGGVRQVEGDWRDLIMASTSDWLLPVTAEVPDRALVMAMRQRAGDRIGVVCQHLRDTGASFHLFRAATLKACMVELAAASSWREFAATAVARLRARYLDAGDHLPTSAARAPSAEAWLIACCGPDGLDCHGLTLRELASVYRTLGYHPFIVGLTDTDCRLEAAAAASDLLLDNSAEAIRHTLVRRGPAVAHVLTRGARVVEAALNGLATCLVDTVGDDSLEFETATPETIAARLAGLIGSLRRRVGIAIGSGVGNMVQCSPTIRRIAEHFDQPVDLILNEDFPGCAALFADAQWVGSVLPYGRETSQICFDVVIVLDSFGDLPPVFNADRLLISRLSLPFSWTRDIHEADFNLLCARSLLDIPYDAADVRRYFVGRTKAAVPIKGRVGLHAGCKPGIWKAKRWPFFGELAKYLIGAGFEVISLGGADEYVPGTVDATGTSLGDTIAMIGSCSYFVANDSGLMHVADARGVPLTAIFAPTSIVKNRPLAATSQIVALEKACAPCQFDRSILAACRCIEEIALDTVWGSVVEHMMACGAERAVDAGSVPAGDRRPTKTDSAFGRFVIFTALKGGDMPVLPPEAVVVQCGWSSSGGFPDRAALAELLDADEACSGTVSGFIFLSPQFVYPKQYLTECVRHFASHRGRDIVIGDVRYDRTAMRFTHHACNSEGEATLGLIGLGCFAPATLRAAVSQSGPDSVRFLRAVTSFCVIPAGTFFPNAGIRFEPALGARAIDTAEHQLGFESAVRAETALSISSRISFFLEGQETPEQMLAQLDRRIYSGRLVALLTQLGQLGLAAELTCRLLSAPSELLKLDNAKFGRLLQTVATIGLYPEFVAALRASVKEITEKYFDQIARIFGYAALVMKPEELGSLLLVSTRWLTRGAVMKPMGPLIDIARSYCPPKILVDLLHIIDTSPHAIQLKEPRLIGMIGDGLVGKPYKPFMLTTSGLTDRDFVGSASVEKRILPSIQSGNRKTFIDAANLLLTKRDGAHTLIRLIRAFTDELATFELQSDEIYRSEQTPLADSLILAIILGDAGKAAPHLDGGIGASTDPLVVAWRSRFNDYTPLNAFLATWLAKDGAKPIQLAGLNRIELFRSCYADHALPDATDHGKVSVILAAHNPDMVLVRMAVESILAQTYRNIELIIVDDGSDAMAAAIFGRLARLDPRIRLLRNPQNCGPYYCRNLALEVAAGAFIAFHDGDDVAHPQRLEVQIEALIGSETYQLCFAAHMRFDSKGRLQFEINPDVPNLRGDGPVTAVCRRQVLDAVGWFAEVRSRGDIEMRSRIQAAYGGHAVRYLTAPLMYCSGGPGNLSLSTTLRSDAYVTLFRRAFRQRAVAPVLGHKAVQPYVGRLSVPFALGCQNRI